MKETTKRAGRQLVGYGSAATAYLLVTRLVDHAKAKLSDDEIAAVVAGFIWVGNRLPWVWSKIRPFFVAIYRRALKWAGASAIVLLLPATARATDVRVPLACSSTVTLLREVKGVGVQEVEECADTTAWLDVVVGIQIVALQLTDKREVVSLGAAPSLGVMIAWRPEGWTSTPHVLAGELSFAMTLISPEIAEGEASHVEIWTVAGLNILGYLAIGIGGRYGIAVRDGPTDFARLVLTSGFRIPI